MKNLVLLFAVLELAANAAFAATVDIHRVIPSKILYQLKEEAAAEVVLQNATDAEQKGTLKLVEEWGVNENRALGAQEVTLAARESKTARLSWKNTATMYGRAVRAEFWQNNAAISVRREFYSVANDWWRVAILNGGSNCPEELRKLLEYYHVPSMEKYLKPGARPLDIEETGPFLTYGNFTHWFAWAPSDFGALTPQEKEWYSGQGRYHMVKETIFKDIATARRWGLRCSAYTANYPGGPAGFEFARQHPEWILRTDTGAFGTADMPVSPFDMAKPLTERPEPWCAVNVDGYWPEGIAYGAQELAASSKMFGWDAWYFDYHYVMMPGWSWDGQKTPHGQDPDQLSARNVRLVRDVVRKEFPRTWFWQNGGCQFGGRFDQGLWSNHGGKAGRLAMLEDPQNGTLMEFQGCQLADPNNGMHHWRTLFEVFLEERNMRMAKKLEADISGTVEMTGYMFNAEFSAQMSKEEWLATRDEWTVANHFGAQLLATKIHPCFISSWSFRPITQFMTRYSAFLWDPAIKYWKEACREISVDALREVWWEDAVYVRETGKTKDYYIHLINAPEQEAANMKANRDPPAADDVEISFKSIKNPTGIQAWALRPYDYGSPRQEPVATVLKPEIVEGSLVLEVPAFRYYTLVVVREGKAEGGRRKAEGANTGGQR